MVTSCRSTITKYQNKGGTITFTNTLALDITLENDQASFSLDLLYELLAQTFYNIWEEMRQHALVRGSWYTTLGMNGKFAPPRWVGSSIGKTVPITYVYGGEVLMNTPIDTITEDMNNCLRAATNEICEDVLPHVKKSL